MSKIRAKNTKPEMIVRRFLFSQGFRFPNLRKYLTIYLFWPPLALICYKMFSLAQVYFPANISMLHIKKVGKSTCAATATVFSNAHSIL